MDYQQFSFQFAQDQAKQLMTLSTGVVTLTFAFAKDFIKEQTIGLRRCMVAAWVTLLFSLIFGYLHLGALTGQLATKADWDAAREEKMEKEKLRVPSTEPATQKAARPETKPIPPPYPAPSTLENYPRWTAMAQVFFFFVGVALIVFFAGASLRVGSPRQIEPAPVPEKPNPSESPEKSESPESPKGR